VNSRECLRVALSNRCFFLQSLRRVYPKKVSFCLNDKANIQPSYLYKASKFRFLAKKQRFMVAEEYSQFFSAKNNF
jgi:hypothetical protein